MVGHIQGDGRIRHICQHQHWSVMYGHFFLFYTEIRKPSFVARIHRPRALGVHTYCRLYFYIPIFLSWRNISSEEIFPKKFHGIFFEPQVFTKFTLFLGLPGNWFEFFDQMTRVLLFGGKKINCLAANSIRIICSILCCENIHNT